MRRVRRYRAMYALYLLYVGIIAGIWPAGLIALVGGALTTDHRFFVPTFVIALCLFTGIIGYHHVGQAHVHQTLQTNQTARLDLRCAPLSL